MAEMRVDRVGLIGLSIVGVAGAALNWTLVADLGAAAGYPPSISWLLWFCLDFLGVIAMRGSFKARTVRVRTWAGASSAFVLLLSSLAAGLHVFVEGDHLPQPIAFGVLSAPAVLIGLSFHLILMLSLEDREKPAEECGPVLQATAERVLPETERSIETSEDTSEVVTETVTTRRQVTARRSGKSAAFIALLKEVEPPTSMSVNDVVAKINPTLPEPLHDASARKLVAQYRRGEV